MLTRAQSFDGRSSSRGVEEDAHCLLCVLLVSYSVQLPCRRERENVPTTDIQSDKNILAPVSSKDLLECFSLSLVHDQPGPFSVQEFTEWKSF